MIIVGVLALLWLPLYIFVYLPSIDSKHIYKSYQLNDSTFIKKYVFHGDKYVFFSEDESELISFGTGCSNEIIYAKVVNDDVVVDVTQKIKKIAGPNGNFYNKKVIFSKFIQKYCKAGSILDIHSELYGYVSIDLDTNTIITY